LVNVTKKPIFAADVVEKTHTTHVKNTVQLVDLGDPARSELTAGRIRNLMVIG
jgi:hypothetical protein